MQERFNRIKTDKKRGIYSKYTFLGFFGSVFCDKTAMLLKREQQEATIKG